MTVLEVAYVFGPYTKFIVEQIREPPRKQKAVSALDILMKSSRMLSQRSLPTSIANPNNNKQKLCNDFIAFLANKDLKWHADEVDSNGESFVKAVVDTLWYIDGQH